MTSKIPVKSQICRLVTVGTETEQNGIVPDCAEQAGAPLPASVPVAALPELFVAEVHMSGLFEKKILLGVTGGIAAYKAADLVRQLRQHGAQMKVVMTESAQAFIAPLTFQALSGQPVHTQLLDSEAEAGMGHIQLAKWADFLVVAPASANFLARLATGQADDLLTTVCLATGAPIFVAPAMNQAMWRNPATRHNCQIIASRSIRILGPGDGSQACGDVGPGRMLEPPEIVRELEKVARRGLLVGKTVVITAGPTREPLDPVRYISNHSSGKMGYALAVAAREEGASTILISGPTFLEAPFGVETIRVETARQMLDQALALSVGADLFIGCAAVADYAAEQIAPQKIKKEANDELHLRLMKNPDVIGAVAQLPQRPFVVGFAAETEDVLRHARGKLQRKKLDLVIANDVADPAIGFNSDRNAVWLLDAEAEVAFPEQGKQQLARRLMQDIAARLERHNSEKS
jgi:phosphopantothenoylcysteine decarboxylase/phosphopantothenate--cysteine ligase